MSVIGLGCLLLFFFSLKKSPLCKHLRVKRRAQSFQDRFVQSCHSFVRIQMVEHSSPWTVRYSSGLGNPRSAATVQHRRAGSLVIAPWASVSSALRKRIWKTRCAQKLHIARKIWGIRFAIPRKPAGVWKPAQPVCAWKRLSSLDIFRYVHLYIGALNAISIRLWLILRCRF